MRFHPSLWQIAKTTASSTRWKRVDAVLGSSDSEGGRRRHPRIIGEAIASLREAPRPIAHPAKLYGTAMIGSAGDRTVPRPNDCALFRRGRCGLPYSGAINDLPAPAALPNHHPTHGCPSTHS